MEHHGRCHCGNLRLILCLTHRPQEASLGACGCAVCRSHGTRTVSDPRGSVEIRAANWLLVEPYGFGTGTADPVDMRDLFGMPLAFLRYGQRPNQHTQRPTINVEGRPE